MSATSENAPSIDIRKIGIDPDFWYPLARSSEVKSGKAHPVSFAGTSILLLRPKSGDVFALENKCAHRQVPLHLGVVDNDGIKCSYHGWKYDRTGRCVSVPYLEKCSLRPSNVRRFPCREAYGLIFVFPGEFDRAEGTAFPKIPAASDPRYKIRYLDRRVECHFTFMHENLMDMNHQFLHRRFMGGIKTTMLDVRHGKNWIEVDYTFARTSGKQPLGETFILGARKKSTDDPRDKMTIRSEYPYQTLKFVTAGSNEPALDLWNVYVPLDKAQRTNHTYGLMMIRRPSVPGLLALLWPFIIWFTNHIFSEDRQICELEQVAFNDQGQDRNHEIFPVIRCLRSILIENSKLL